mgnify:CR=1 FL=1
MSKLKKLSKSEMNAIIGGESNHGRSGGKWVYDSNNGIGSKCVIRMNLNDVAKRECKY